MMATFQPYEEGGITGKSYKDQLAQALQGTQAPPMQSDTQAPAAQASGLGQYALSGFDMNKFSDPNRSEKYKIGEVFSRYDPKGGITDALLNELNGLGIAQFSGSGDKLTVNNTKNDPRFGRGGTADVIRGLKGQNADTAWQPWFVEDNPQSAPSQAGVPGINGMLQSNAFNNINQALSALQQPGLLQRLIASLNGEQ